ncbi:iron complex transport system substrate-binding protein [Paenibacillus algorifonticola]|uniref:Iron complex transport system substrate-binding protein n=1 Tax=Paenibacillus algorifonticola TaxID=684063 RepID=A0A1I2IX94_9BACL|nr:iron-siderophore ABC transporter substrate-binding protein [Paenibacillus algorifonticola]SFF47112.1 iron complex transport system substrate-binding protein [Paenibacillus algorifonticola]
MNKRLMGLIMVIVVMLVAAGCGSNTTNSSAAEGTTTENATATNTNGDTAAAGPIVLKDAKGEVKLDKPAQKVIVLEWTFTEDVIALGVQPVGNADNAQYKLYVTSEAPLDANVTDVGMRDAPNLETIAALKPDLIIANTDSHEAIYDQLKGIAPTLIFSLYPLEGESNQYDQMEEVFKTIAAAVGKTEEGTKVLADLDAHYADAKAKLDAAGKGGLNYVLTQAYSYQNAATMRLFTDNSLAVQTLDRIGLKNDWKSENFEVYGFSTSTVEALPAVQDTNLIYIVQKDDDIFSNELKDNSVWNGLTFVKEKRTYGLDSATWVFGGPISSKVIVDEVVNTLTK